MTSADRLGHHGLLPLGRAPTHPRHATEISGGTYHAILMEPVGDRWSPDIPEHLAMQERSERGWREGMHRLLQQARGPLIDGRDALDDLAEGKRRPSEVKNAELPQPLWDADLEPLLDSIWDVVDARAVFADLMEQLDQLPAPGHLGEALATSALEPPRRMPSRR